MSISSARTYRISTQISDEYGNRLENLQRSIRSDCGKKLKIAEIIELGIKSLEIYHQENVKTLAYTENIELGLQLQSMSL